jgi:quercetin dioxygenase-like cupin family protein
MTEPLALVHRWDEIALEKITEMVSRKVISGDRMTVAQVYLKRGTLVPRHSHSNEQMSCVLQGALRVVVGDEEITVREGEVLHVPASIEHQAEALDDTFVLDLFSPARADWASSTPPAE